MTLLLCRSCIPCGFGTYNPTVSTFCLSCDGTITGSYTKDTGTASADGCICPDGTYFQPGTDDTKPEWKGRCIACPHGARCPEGSDITTIETRRGFWRTSATSSEIKACEYSDACLGGEGSGACAQGYSGTLCAVCAPGYSQGIHHGECTSCDGLLLSRVVTVLLLLVLPVIALLCYVYFNAESLRHGTSTGSRSSMGVFRRLFVVDRSAPVPVSYAAVVGANAKLLVAYYQVS